MMRLVLLAAVVLMVATTVSPGAPVKKAKGPSKQKPPAEAGAAEAETVNPGVFLLRDPLVQEALRLSGSQKSAAAALAAEFNESIWRFRDAGIDSEVAVKEARRLNALIEPRLAELLSADQRDRLSGIALQVQGISALQLASTAEILSLSREQQARIAKLASAARTMAAKLSKNGDDDAERARRIGKLQEDLQRELLAVLTGPQRDRWRKLCGAPIELAKLQPLTAQAPEVRGVTEWINSEPLTLEGLRGKVVALHFWTFG